MGWFKGKEAYTKTKAFEDHRNIDLAVKRVIYRFDYNGLMYSISLLSYMSDTKWNLSIHFRYFMRELAPHGGVVKPELPMFLTSWEDKLRRPRTKLWRRPRGPLFKSWGKPLQLLKRKPGKLRN
jgi:hypothetical protein